MAEARQFIYKRKAWKIRHQPEREDPILSAQKQSLRRIVIVGIPGVGKSSVVSKLIEELEHRRLEYRVVNYGTVMMEEASKIYGVKSRDDMRKLTVDIQRKMQIHAASEISKLSEDYVVVDTHLFISTAEGFWPGMPMEVLQALGPTNLVMVVATPDEIMVRRKNDSTRARDVATRESLDIELSVANSLLYSTSLICGCPALVVSNPDGKVESAVEKIIKAILSS